MEFSVCKKPCNDCPFTKSSLPGWLADYTPQQLHMLVMSETPFPCHLTHEDDISIKEAGTTKYPLCAGALAFMKKNGKMPKDLKLAKFVGEISRESLSEILSVREFYKHHEIIKQNV